MGTGAAKKRGTKTEVEGRTSVNDTLPEDVPAWFFTTTGTGVWLLVAGAAGTTAFSSFAAAATTSAGSPEKVSALSDASRRISE